MHGRSSIIAIVWLAIGLLAEGVCALADWKESFDGPTTSWQVTGGSVSYQVRLHERAPSEGRERTGCERLAITCGNATIQLSHLTGGPRVIGELLPTVWVKSDGAEIHLSAEVTLPRSEDPRTGRPITVRVAGDDYRDFGNWRPLRVDGWARRLPEAVRALRAQFGSYVDEKEAILSRIFLTVYCRRGTNNIWIDDLTIAGYAAVGSQSERSAERIPKSPTSTGGIRRVAAVAELAVPSQAGADTRRFRDRSLLSHSPDGSVREERPTPRLSGSVLTVDDRPLFPRIIRHQGEPLAMLRRLGFNTVWLSQPASPAILREATASRIWLICPPPHFPTPRQQHAVSKGAVSQTPGGPVSNSKFDGYWIDEQYDCVLAWNLGQKLDDSQLEMTRQWAEQIRSADRFRERPLICQAETNLAGYSNLTRLLLLDRHPIASSLSLADHGAWLRSQPRLAELRTPVWATIQTQPNAALDEQLRLLRSNGPPPSTVSSAQLRALTYQAIASGSRGLLFDSRTPLNLDTPDSRHRAMMLELMNLELRLIGPWLGTSSFVTSAKSSTRDVFASVLRTNRSHMLLPVWAGDSDQFTSGQAAAKRVTFVVPGVPGSSKAYELTPSGLSPLRHERGTMGMRIAIDEFDGAGPILMTSDDLQRSRLHNLAGQLGPRIAELQRHLATRKLHTVRQVLAQLPNQGVALGQNSSASGRSRVATRSAAQPGLAQQQIATWLETANKSLQFADRYLATGDYRQASVFSQRTMRALRLVERAYWEAATRGMSSPLEIPGATGFDTLPWHWAMVHRLRASHFGPGRLPGGDCERLSSMTACGWRHFQHRLEGILATADLGPQAAHSGFAGLQLRVAAEDTNNKPVLVESAPVWVVSPTVSVEPEELLCIEGWVNVPESITGSVDGLMIIDSLTGDALAERIKQTDGWRRFVLYRIAPRSGQVTITFALTGFGEARIDDVTIRTLALPSSANTAALPYAPLRVPSIGATAFRPPRSAFPMPRNARHR